MAKKAGKKAKKPRGGHTTMSTRPKPKNSPDQAVVDAMKPVLPEDKAYGEARMLEAIELGIKDLQALRKKVEAGTIEPEFALSSLSGKPFQLAPGEVRLYMEINVLNTRRTRTKVQVPGRPGQNMIEFCHGPRIKE
jgi:hypothetical protein